jgi:hypothetical protein
MRTPSSVWALHALCRVHAQLTYMLWERRLRNGRGWEWIVIDDCMHTDAPSMRLHRVRCVNSPNCASVNPDM